MASTTTEERKMPEWQKEFLTGSIMPAAEAYAAADFVPYTGSFTPEMSDYTTRAGGLYGDMAQLRNAAPDVSDYTTAAGGLYGDIAQMRSRAPAISDYTTRAGGLYGDIAQMGSLAPEVSDYTTRAGGIYGDIAQMGQMTPQDYAARTQANMDPYQSEVIDASLAMMDRQQERARTASEARLIGAGGIDHGGRRAVYEAEFDAGNLADQNQLISQMMQQGYSQAQAQTMAQISQQQGALSAGGGGLSNVGAADTAQRMAQLSYQRDSLGAGAAGLSGVGAADTAQRMAQLSYEMDALRSGAAGLSSVGAAETAQKMAQLSQEMNALSAGAAGLSSVGAVDTSLQNQELQARYAEFARENDLPLSQLNALLSAAGGIPQGYGTTSSTDPFGGLTAVGNVLSGAGSAGQGYNAAFR